MAVSTAVILAAGRGMRLGDDYRERPKGFIPCQGTTLIERSLSLLTSCGISRVFIVTGHCADFYDDLAARSAGLVTTLFNDRYATNGSLVSFMTVLDAVDEPFLVLDSDIVYERRALPALLNCSMENAALVSGTTDSGDEYYAWADQVAGQPLPTIRRLSKRLTDEPGNGPGGGIQIGFDYQMNSIVLGMQAITSISGFSSSENTADGSRLGTELTSYGSLNARLGYLLQPELLVYGKGGLAFGSFKYSDKNSAAGYSGSQNDVRSQGWMVGGGVEYKFAPSWSAFAEYDYTFFGSQSETLSYKNASWGDSYKFNIDQDIGSAVIGVNYRF